MTDHTDLIRRLRGHAHWGMTAEAADALEAVTRERDAVIARAEAAERERDDYYERWNDCQEKRQAAEAARKEAVGVIEKLRLTARPFDTGDTDHDNAMRAADAFLAQHGGTHE